MKLLVSLGLAIGLPLAAAPAFAQSAAPLHIPAAAPSGSSADRAALEYVVRDSVGEVQACRLAERKTSDPHVAAFCRTMIADHTRMIQDALALAPQVGLTAQEQQLVPDAEGRIELAELSSLNGKQFDQSFMRDQVSDHENDITTMRDAMEAAADARVRSFDQEMVDRLSHHLELANDTLAEVDRAS